MLSVQLHCRSTTMIANNSRHCSASKIIQPADQPTSCLLPAHSYVFSLNDIHRQQQSNRLASPPLQRFILLTTRDCGDTREKTTIIPAAFLTLIRASSSTLFFISSQFNPYSYFIHLYYIPQPTFKNFSSVDSCLMIIIL